MAGIVKALGLFAVGAFVSSIVRVVASESLHHIITKATAFEEAKRLAGARGIINLGAGPHRTLLAQELAASPEVLANVDVAMDGMPQFLQLDMETEPLPFGDKQYGVAFASHVLEHLSNWQFALAEACRVADYVVVVLPHPAYFSGWFDPEHRQHFSRDDIDEIAQLYPNVEVYY